MADPAPLPPAESRLPLRVRLVVQVRQRTAGAEETTVLITPEGRLDPAPGERPTPFIAALAEATDRLTGTPPSEATYRLWCETIIALLRERGISGTHEWSAHWEPEPRESKE